MEPAPKAGSNTDAPGSATAPTGGGSSALWISGTYRLLELLGAGSSGEVYEAEHVRLGKRVALKILRREAIAKPNIVRRFDREAGALARLTSDFVVTVFDCGTTSDGRPYLVMERLVGEDLKALLAREGKLDL